MSAPFPQVDPIRRETMSAEIARRLVDHLLSGNIAPGSRLPSERQLAEAFGVGRSAVREALAALSLIGLIEIRHGDGTYLKRADSPLLPQVVEWGLLLGEQHTADLIEARQRIEVVVAGLAAERRSESDLAVLEVCLARMGEQAAPGGDSAAFVDADVEFHLALAEAAGNSALRDVLASIQSLLRTWISRVLAEGYEQSSYEEHVPIVTAVRAQDPEAAATAMDAHMRSAASRLQATLDRSTRGAHVHSESEGEA
ncbi:MAG: FadR family transcriptional regulator [Thermomicrobiales bacterium]|nr:FadR family transcriptional regulator [Thermomicrobiales bacterium]